MRKILCVCAVLVCLICIIGCKKKNVTEKIEDNNKNVTSVESSVSQEDSSIQDTNNQNEAMQPSELKLPDDSEIESELNLTKNERNTEVGLDDKASEKEIKKDSEESNVMNTSDISNSVSLESYAEHSETNSKDNEVANNVALEQLRKELIKSFDTEKQQLLETQKAELTKEFNTQIEVKAKEYEEEKETALEQLRKELTESFDAEKQQLLETQKTELTEQFNTQLELKTKEYEEQKQVELAQQKNDLIGTLETAAKKSEEILRNQLEDEYNRKIQVEIENQKELLREEVVDEHKDRLILCIVSLIGIIFIILVLILLISRRRKAQKLLQIQLEDQQKREANKKAEEKEEKAKQEKLIQDEKRRKEKENELKILKVEFASYLEEYSNGSNLNDLCQSVLSKQELKGYSYSDAVEILRFCIKTYEEKHGSKFSYLQNYGIFFDDPVINSV